MRQRGRDGGQRGIQTAGEQLGVGAYVALVLHYDSRCVGIAQQQFHGQVWQGAMTRGTEGQTAGRSLAVRDQVFHRLERTVRVHNEEQRGVGDLRDRFQILVRVVAELAV